MKLNQKKTETEPPVYKKAEPKTNEEEINHVQKKPGTLARLKRQVKF